MGLGCSAAPRCSPARRRDRGSKAQGRLGRRGITRPAQADGGLTTVRSTHPRGRSGRPFRSSVSDPLRRARAAPLANRPAGAPADAGSKIWSGCAKPENRKAVHPDLRIPWQAVAMSMAKPRSG